jgi:hypothetical protein
MKLKIKKTKMPIEAKVLEAIVLNTDFLRLYQHIYRRGVLSTCYGEWLSETCIEYYRKHNTAPLKDIKDILKSGVKGGRVPNNILEPLEGFVKELPYESPPTINHGYLSEKVRNHFVLLTHKELMRKLEVAIEKGDAELCEKAVADLKSFKLQTGQVCNPFEDKQKVMDAFLRDEKQLFKLPGALGRMMNPQFKSKRFMAFLGTPKRGKTWILYRLAKAAKRFGNHVAIFAAGDEDEDSSIVRLGCMLTGKNPDDEFCGQTAFPVMDCAKNQEQTGCPLCKTGGGLSISKAEMEMMSAERLLQTEKKHKPCTKCRHDPKRMTNFDASVWYEMRNVEKLTWQTAWKHFKLFHRFTPKASVRLFTYSSNTLTVSEMNRQLDMAEDMDGWVPTVVLVDYPDIMADESKDNEKRHKENDKWTKLRKMSQDRSVFLGVVSQSNSGGQGAESLETTNVNEDRRKLDHVTAMYGLNQTDAEKRRKMMRIGPIVQRKGKFDTEYQVLVLQCLEMGNPFVDSNLVYRKRKTDKKI